MGPFLLFLSFAACDRTGESFVPTPNPDYPFVQDLGEFRVITEDEIAATEDWTPDSEAARAEDDEGRKGVHYGGLGAPENLAYYGGATFQFLGTGGDVCVVMDPEAVYWIQARSPDAGTGDYLYKDVFEDDADLDLNVGLTAYYTGSPGVEMGNFELLYSDAGGVDHSLEFNECIQGGFQGDSVHAGRASVESCTIDTAGKEGISYTGVIDTFLLPIDDSVAHFAVAVFEGSCGDFGVDECLLPREFSGGLTEETAEDCEDDELSWTFACLEEAYCKSEKRLNEYCEQHFEDDGTICVDNGLHPPKDEEPTEEE